MTTRPEARPGRGLCGDERGAIMVMGIFMCACLVGILWYLAGIGDAIVFRERLQEGADATAFTAAVLHARGMNLLVMINLIMACILAVRVALRVAYIVLQVLAIALAWIGVGGGIGVVAGEVKAAGNITDPFITEALEALTVVEGIIPHVVPPAAIVGSIQVSLKYNPLVKEGAAGNPVTTKAGLPVEDGDPSVLCFQAAKAVVDIIFSFPGVSTFRTWIGGAFGDLVAAGGDYFCGLGGSSNPPDLSSLVNSSADTGCDEKKKKLQQDSDAAAQAYQDACDGYRASCSSQLQPNQTPATLTATEQADLSAKQGDAETKLAALNAYNGDDCRKESKDKINQSLQNNNSSSSSSSGKIAPRRVTADWLNGVPNAQMLAVAVGDTKYLQSAPKFVSVGQWQSGGTITVPESAQFSLAQAEYFYDCNGKWESHSCNGKNKPGGFHRDDQELAMWNFKWRARLRRYNKPFQGSVPGLDNLSGALNGLVAIQRIGSIKPLNAKSLENALLLKELGEVVFANPDNLIIH
jgi:hypothetical protein